MDQNDTQTNLHLKKMFNIALYQPDIPQNTAAIIRLCSCFNTTLEIIEPCGFYLSDERLKRVAMDYLSNSSRFTIRSIIDPSTKINTNKVTKLNVIRVTTDRVNLFI